MKKRFIPVLIGLFSIPEALDLALNPTASGDFVRKLKGNLFFELSEYIRMAGNFIKSSLIGVFIGIIPAAGPVIAPFVSYREAKRSSKFPEKFGTGIPDGVVAAEAANNGVTGGSLVPLLTLGIPGSAVAAVYLGALTIHGLRPGPMLFQNNPDVIYGLFKFATTNASSEITRLNGLLVPLASTIQFAKKKLHRVVLPVGPACQPPPRCRSV